MLTISIRLFFLVMVFLAMDTHDLSGQLLERLKEAEAAYHKGDYSSAEDIYTGLLKEGYTAGDIHFNLGNVCFQQGKTACAVLHYEKALKYNPHDHSARSNLALARSGIKDKVLPIEPFFVVRWFDRGRNFLSETVWAIIALIAFWISIGILAYRYRYRKEPFRLALPLVWFAGIAFVLAFIFSLSQRNLANSENRVVVMDNSNLYDAPSRQSNVKLELSPGETAEIIDSVEQLYKIELENLETGWIHKEKVSSI